MNLNDFMTNYYSKLKLGSCSHSRANEFYVESIQNYKAGEAFMSKSCNSWKDFENKSCHDHLGKISMGYGLDINK